MILNATATISSPGAPTAILLNSFGLGVRDWFGLDTKLAERCNVVAVDRRGHGATPWSPLGDFSDLVTDVLDTVAALGITGPWLPIGLSLGGLEAMTLAIESQDRVIALVVINSFAWTPATVAAQKIETSKKAFAEGGTAAAAENSARAMLAASGDENLIQLVSGALASVAEESQLALMEVLYAADLRAELSAVTAPVLVLGGEEDTRTPSAESRDLASMFPHGDFRIVPGAGHLAIAEQPQIVSRFVATFLDAVIA